MYLWDYLLPIIHHQKPSSINHNSVTRNNNNNRRTLSATFYQFYCELSAFDFSNTWLLSLTGNFRMNWKCIIGLKVNEITPSASMNTIWKANWTLFCIKFDRNYEPKPKGGFSEFCEIWSSISCVHRKYLRTVWLKILPEQSDTD